jgi:hypothetical protein
MPVPGFWPEPSNLAPADLLFWINSKQPDWVREARTLASRLRYPDPSVQGAATSGCTITSFGNEEFFELAYADGARFFVDNAGARVSVAGPPTLSIEYLATYLRGPIMGFVLRQRGVTSLHGAAACIGTAAIVLCGGIEAGKSTTVAALSLRNFSILSDDITALREEDGGFQVEPGYPWICLWPDAVRNLLGDSDASPQLTSSWDKRYLPLGKGGFEPIRRPLAAVYLLGPRVNEPSAPRVEATSAREAVLELVQNTYMNWLLDGRQRASEFDVLSRLASNLPVRRLVPHVDPARIGLLCDLIVADAEAFITGSR